MSVQAFDLSYAGTGFEDHKDERRADFMAALSAKTGRRWIAEWDTARDVLHARARPAMPALAPHPGLPPGLPWHLLPVADGVTFDLLSTSHLLVVGATNSGKTSVIRSIIVAGARSSCRLWLGDPKRVELIGFRGWPGVEIVATTDETLAALAGDIHAEMEKRYAAFEENGVPLDSHDPILLVIDEYEEFAARMKAYAAATRTKVPGADSPAQSSITSVLRLARKARIHVVIGTQRPDASWFGGGARDNLQGRVMVGRATADAARMLFGRSDVARDVPASAKGRITAQMGDGEPIEAQAYWVGDPGEQTLSTADAAILTRLRP